MSIQVGQHVKNVGRTLPTMLGKPKATESVRADAGPVCRANWRPGKDTLYPFVSRVGQR